jgi:hypothetical protein
MLDHSLQRKETNWKSSEIAKVLLVCDLYRITPYTAENIVVFSRDLCNKFCYCSITLLLQSELGKSQSLSYWADPNWYTQLGYY